MHRRILQIGIGVLIAFVISCAGGGSPVEPDDAGGSELPLSAMRSSDSHSAPVLWGYWDIVFDPESKTVDITPNRTVDFALNIVKFLNNDPTSVSIVIDIPSLDNQPEYFAVGVDMTITHPIDDAGFDAYDVRGIFISNGSGTLDYSPDLIWPVYDTDQTIGNADGYTRWWNPPEFYTETIFGYIPGLYSLPPDFAGTATLNGYKYYGEGLGAKDSAWDYLISGAPDAGTFYHGTSNTRRFDLRFPKPDPGVKFGYAVVANWAGTDPIFHPSHADEAVGIDVEIVSSLFYEDETNNGGEVSLDISIFDWYSELTGGVMEDYRIILESPVLLNPYTLNTSELTPTASGDHFFTYHVEFDADGVPSGEDQPLWIIVEYPDIDYTNPPGVPNDADGDPVAAVFKEMMYVSPVCPPMLYITAPNGGEQWSSGMTESITWFASSDIQHVDLEYSKDDFVSDVSTIATELNAFSGAYDWDIPYDGSETVKVRVKESSDPDVRDDSDEYFTIVAPDPSITVQSPNGGEVLTIGSDQVIYWDSVGVSGTVKIEYSKDGFVSDVNTIATDEECDGDYLWDPIPDDQSSTVRVRVSLTDDPLVYDDSDADFSIVPGVPETGWASTWGGTNIEQNNDVTFDAEGNVYALGMSGSAEAVLEKLNSAGESQWRIQWQTGYSSFFGAGVAVDGSGNSYVTATFCGIGLDFDPGPGEDLHTSVGETWDCFLSKFDTGGIHQWTLQWGGYGDDKAQDIGIDDAGNIFVTGYFQEDGLGNAPDFDPGPGEDIQYSNGSYDAFMSSFDTSGNYQGVKVWGGEDFEYSHAIDVDGAGNICVTGNFSGLDADFDPGPGEFLLSSASSMDVWVSLFNSDGDFQWARCWPGTYIGTNGVAIDDLLNVYASGGFTGTTDFDPGPGTESRTSNGMEDAFVSKFDSDGNFLRVGTWGGWDSDYTTDVDCDGSENFYVTGSFGGDDVDFDPGVGEELFDSNGTASAYVIKFNSSFEFQWARTWCATGNGYAMGSGLAATESGNFHVSGFFTGMNVQFAPIDAPCMEDSDIHSSNGSHDTFVMKYMSDGCW